MDYCSHCSSDSIKISHSGICPKIKAIEYYRNGNIKRVEFKTPADYMQPLAVETWPPPREIYPSETGDSTGVIFPFNGYGITSVS